MHPDYNYQRTIDIGSFIRAVFRYWRQALAVGVVCGIIFALIPVIRYRANSGSEQTAVADEISADAEQYITAGEYEAAISNMERILASKKKYLVNSYLMTADPFNEPLVRDYIYVDLLLNPEEIRELEEIGMLVGDVAALTESGDNQQKSGTSTDRSDTDSSGHEPIGVDTEVEYLMARVLSEYQTFLTSRIDWSEIAEKLDTEPGYIKECVTVETLPDSAEIIISVKCVDLDNADLILDYAREKIQLEHDSVSERMCDHTLEAQARSHEVIYDSQMKNAQESFASEIATSQTRLDNFKDAKSSYVYSGAPRTSLNKKTVLKNCVIGFLGGILICLVISAALLMAGGRVISAKELMLSYNMRILASVRTEQEKRLRGLGSRFRKSGERNSDEDDIYRKAALMTELYRTGSGRIIVTGDVSSQELKETAGELQKNLSGIELICCDTLLENAQQLRESSGLILVEKRNVSRLGSIENDIETAGDLRIPIIGAILL